MCGILVSVAIKGSEKSALNGLTPWIAARGPDSLQTQRIQIPFPDTQQSVELTFTSSVLHLRGHDVSVQPLVSQSGDILCWNGEIWQGLSVADDENDGLKLLDELVSGKKVWEVLGQIEGPWAMVFYDASKRRLWYGRDCLGRRSLMRKMIRETGELLLSSVGVDMDGWDEVGVEGLGCLELQEFINNCSEVPIPLARCLMEVSTSAYTMDILRPSATTRSGRIHDPSLPIHEQIPSHRNNRKPFKSIIPPRSPDLSPLNPHPHRPNDPYPSFIQHGHTTSSRNPFFWRFRLLCSRMADSHFTPRQRVDRFD